MSGYPFALALAVATLVLLAWLLRSRRLRQKYAFLWVALAVSICVLGVFPKFLFLLASFLGVETPINVLFSGAIVVLFLVAVQISAEVSRLEDQTRTVAECLALLEMRLDELEAGHPETPPAQGGRPDAEGITPRPHRDQEVERIAASAASFAVQQQEAARREHRDGGGDGQV